MTQPAINATLESREIQPNDLIKDKKYMIESYLNDDYKNAKYIGTFIRNENWGDQGLIASRFKITNSDPKTVPFDRTGSEIMFYSDRTRYYKSTDDILLQKYNEQEMAKLIDDNTGTGAGKSVAYQFYHGNGKKRNTKRKHKKETQKGNTKRKHKKRNTKRNRKTRNTTK
jgi:hypothetical protein